MHPKPITQRKTYEEIRARRKKRRWKKVTERRSTFASATHGWRGNTLDSAVRWANALESHWAFLFLLLTMRLRLNKRSAGHSMDLAHFSVFRFRSSWLSPCCSVSSTMSSSSSSWNITERCYYCSLWKAITAKPWHPHATSHPAFCNICIYTDDPL